jgi:hypothetical protein
MTADEIRDNYEFKVVRKALMREFPFVKDVLLDDENLSKYKYILPVNLVIDPFVLALQYNVGIKPLYLKLIKKDDKFITASLDMMFDDRDRVRYIDGQMDKLSREIHNSPALPSEYKLPRPLTMSLVIVDQDSIPQDMRD